MAIESWLSQTYDHRSAVCTSSAGLQTMIAASLTAVGWSNPSANTYKSPGSTKWVQVVFSQPAADKLEVALTEYGGRTATNRRVGTVTNPSTWKITATAYNFILWCSAGSTGFYWCGVLSHFPKAQDSHSLDVYYAGYHNTSDANYAANFNYMEVAIYNSTFSLSNYGGARLTGEYTSNQAVRSASGVRRDYAWMVNSAASSGVFKYAGRVHQVTLVDTTMANDSQFLVPLDETTNATFVVIPSGGFLKFKLAARVS